MHVHTLACKLSNMYAGQQQRQTKTDWMQSCADVMHMEGKLDSGIRTCLKVASVARFSHPKSCYECDLCIQAAVDACKAPRGGLFHLEVIDLSKDLACQALTVDEVAPLGQRWAASSNLICQPHKRPEDLHAAVVDEMSLQSRILSVVCACYGQRKASAVDKA